MIGLLICRWILILMLSFNVLRMMTGDATAHTGVITLFIAAALVHNLWIGGKVQE